MSVKFIPPRDPNETRLTQIKDAISKVLDGHISGRGKKTKIERAVNEIVLVLRPLLKLAPKPDKGATVMTEAASSRRGDGSFGKRPSNL